MVIRGPRRLPSTCTTTAITVSTTIAPMTATAARGLLLTLSRMPIDQFPLSLSLARLQSEPSGGLLSREIILYLLALRRQDKSVFFTTFPTPHSALDPCRRDSFYKCPLRKEEQHEHGQDHQDTGGHQQVPWGAAVGALEVL